MKLLIAEDDAFFRRLLEQILAPKYQLVLTENGRQAWTELQNKDAPSLVILDWVMPEMSGPQLCRQIRQSPHLSSMYVILLTARNSVADVVSGLRAGADDYITKPFEPEVLRSRVKIGERIVSLQRALNAQLAGLRECQWREARLQKLLASCTRGGKLGSRSEDGDVSSTADQAELILYPSCAENSCISFEI